MSLPASFRLDVRSRSARLADALLRLHDTPARTAAAFALGVFFSFSPFIGLQILVSMAIAFMLRLNRVAVFVGLNANLPWTMVPWYAGTTLAAAAVMGSAGAADAGRMVAALFADGWTPAGVLDGAQALVTPVLVPFLVGPTVGAIPIALVSYVLARTVLVRRARRATAAE